jgi:hypothetical protein
MGDDLKEVGIAVAAGIITTEVLEWSDFAARWLMDKAVSRLPGHLRERYMEEWAADLGDFPGNLAKIIRAAGYVWASLKMIPPDWENLRSWLLSRFPVVLPGWIAATAALTRGDWVGFGIQGVRATLVGAAIICFFEFSPLGRWLVRGIAKRTERGLSLAFKQPMLLRTITRLILFFGRLKK